MVLFPEKFSLKEVYGKVILFIMCDEIIAMHTRENNNIKSIIFKGYEMKISQYADDTIIILHDLNSVSKSINTVNKFSKLAGS